MKRLIINADDFGLTRGVNAAVIRVHREGVLTSATLMAGGLAWREAVELALANPGLGVGVHLTLTALRSVLPPAQVPSLVDREGRFRRQFWRAPLWRKAEVESEWRAQIQRLVEAGLRPTHLDSHHHTHLWPGAAKIALALAREFGIPALRFISPLSFRIMDMGGWQRRIALKSWQLAQDIQGNPDTVVGLEALQPIASGLTDYLRKLPPGVHELFCHPGSQGDADLAGISSLTEKRALESDILCAPWFKETLAREGIIPASYKLFGEERVT